MYCDGDKLYIFSSVVLQQKNGVQSLYRVLEERRAIVERL